MSAACRSDSFNGIESACSSEIAAWSPTDSVEDLAAQITERCAVALGATINLDVQSFEASDEGQVALEHVLTGLLVLAMDDLRSPDELLSDPFIPTPLESEFSRLSDSAHGGAPLSFTLVESWVSATRFAETVSSQWGGNAAANYDIASGVVTIGPGLLDTGTEHPAFVTATLIHEATHGFGPPHQDCEEAAIPGACDPDTSGSYGAEVWWLNGWMTTRDSVLSDDMACLDLENYKLGRCNVRIEDHAGWEPCDRVCPR